MVFTTTAHGRRYRNGNVTTAMLAAAIVDSVKECDRGYGVPKGPIYAAMMAKGCTLDQFNQFIAILVRIGKLREDGDLLFAVEAK